MTASGRVVAMLQHAQGTITFAAIVKATGRQPHSVRDWVLKTPDFL
jgi:hypothetical protein